ncbi:MAG: valine--tRNA ligase [Gemmatimonadaceae bacterium]
MAESLARSALSADEGALPAQYDPGATEREVYARWSEAGVFVADPARSARTGGERVPFVIVMPPPNVTAVLHVGHGLNNTVQDVLVRWRRMAGDEALWVPGTDHAGIATQNVIEKQLAAEGQTRGDLGREAFIARTRDFVDATGGQILDQLRAIGASADWSRTAYTFSPHLSRAVREAFVRLWDEGLIYRGHRVIHWCPRCLTSLSDEEAEHHDEQGTLYHIRYSLADDGDRSVTVATTRPETMLGDVAVAVHPDDERYRDLIGRRVLLPIAGIEIPVVGDVYADPAFGTGVVKITPAHDANDFDVARRHGLPMPVVMTPEATMGEGEGAAGRVPPSLRGLDRSVARERIVAMLRESGNLVRAESHGHSVRHCYRCDTVVEPRLSDQWFVRMAPLAAPALAGVRSGRIRILPERWEAVYINWLEGIRDWNISRQLWWGHRIPVWYCDACGSEPIVARTDPSGCPTCGGAVRQDDDVLDTWFSSWLWPLSTLGWPDDTPDLAAFYPTDVIVTAPEILFFWVSRMIMAGYHFAGDAPYHTVYLHGTARDTHHVKMSKSLGNGIDPLDVVARYGADALRWTLIAGMGMGADVILDPEDLDKSFGVGRNFATKLWNMGRFVLLNVGDDPARPLAALDATQLTRADRWILGRLDNAVAECDGALGKARPDTPASAHPRSPAPPRDPGWLPSERFAGLRLNEYAEAARRFTWDEVAAWYLESIKGRLVAGGGNDGDREVARSVLIHVFDAALRLLHPIVPFITEALWQRLPGRGEGTYLAVAPWPMVAGSAHGGGGEEFDRVRALVSAVRQIKSDYNVPASKLIDASVVPHDGAARRIYGEEAPVASRLARCTLHVTDDGARSGAATALLPDGAELVVPLAGLIDVAKECTKLKSELASLEKQTTSLEQRLANAGFVERAPKAVVDAERAKLVEWRARGVQLRSKVTSLCGG